MRRSTVTEHARRRAAWKLPALKLLDELRTNEAIEFTHESRTFHAFITRDALIACDELEHASRRATSRRGATTLVYEHPTNFTLDCVDEYWRALGRANETHTNPNGWDRLRRVRDGATLNEIRDRLVRDGTYAPPPPTTDDASSSTATTVDDTLDRGNPSELASRILCSDSISVESLRDGGGGYKVPAHALEATTWQLLHVVDAYESIIERLLADDGPRRSGALDEARRVLAERKRREQHFDGALDLVESPRAVPKRTRLRLASIDVASLLNVALDAK